MRLLSFLLLLVMPWTVLAHPYTAQSSIDTVQYSLTQSTQPGCYVYPTTFDVNNLDTVTELEDPTLAVEDILANYPETVFEISSRLILDWGTHPITTTDWLDAGTLHYGFQEALHSSNEQRNGILEVNDIPQWYNDATSDFDGNYAEAIESHISNQTLMILPASNLDYTISTFVRVRALEYNSTTDTIKLALVDSHATYSCMNTPTTAKVKQNIDVTAYSSLYNSVVSYSWSWGDGTPHIEGRQAQHAYDLPGIYRVQLIIQYADGTHKIHNQNIQVTQDHFGSTECFVYPLTFHESEILGISELPYPQMEVAQIYNSYPDTIFEVQADPVVGNFQLLAWIQEFQSTANMWGNGGSLSDGLQEASLTTVERVNGFLEIGDFVTALTGNVGSLTSFFDYHIANKTIMIFPAYDQRTGTGTSRQYRISRFVAVRFLDYVLSPVNQRSLTFALVEGNASHACFSSAGHVFAGNPNIVTPRTPLNQELAHMWDFGDGTTAPIRDVSHVYTQTGTYSVTLTTTNTSNFVAQAFGSVTVEEPVALELSTSSPNFVGSTTIVTATLADYAEQARVLTYTVNWGDDSQLEPFTVTAETTTTLELTHTYQTADVYTPTMTLLSPQGAMLQRSTSLMIFDPTAINLQAAQVNLATWNFTATVTGTAPFSYTWNWGDGSEPLVTSSPSATHTFAQAGTYTVTLTVTDANGWQVEQDYVVEVVLQRVFLPMLHR